MLTLILGVNSGLDINVCLSRVNTDDRCEYILRVINTKSCQSVRYNASVNTDTTNQSLMLSVKGP